MDRIEGKVATVLTAESLVISRGAESGVEVGMRFRVLNRRGIGVKDPDTGELLGNAEVSKAEVKVISVEARFATARTFRTYTSGMADIFPFGRTVRESMDVDDDVAEESKIRVGDPVIQVIEVK